ncbi:hypothetical protein BD309DRAFT_995627 [Dichomitus squalens]|uniref:Uncharacterized protein n=2 Tax=Dichomitus squalens TaxID=114155 RepID=A0A4Q9PFF5_9APHY|nr:uncharacterized protein DICSQDRAFT_175641 [Dichomitus squalens LYAD-421 SS1]EJF55679.1 hypothetical protein DICSQDRAFT_175641 [Dichomitus squalens LYAD-421 SS1]TBU21338.1 hypothetical protein BD311DRAFT_782970 [Dichomitus squalens]TBU36391.1 hypothetical protein BD309DRAFT_995627 [Dichomitus squalens]TBU51016.1 hypothetical protein BD310DRAFT_953448 [Dichomitus squalens]
MEFAIRLDAYNNIEPVLYDALVSRITYEGEVDIWNTAQTRWCRLPREASWDLSPNYTSVCVRATQGAGFTPGLGWEISRLEEQHGSARKDVGVDAPEPSLSK